MSIHSVEKPAKSHVFNDLELVLLEEWCTSLRLNKSIYSDASRYYARLGNILSIISGVSKGIAGATVLTAALASTFNIPQYIITIMTIVFIVISTIISAIVDSMEFKPKSILYEETSRSCYFLIKEIELQCVNHAHDVDFDSFSCMVRSWHIMITSRAGKVPERIVKANIARHQNTNIVLETLNAMHKKDELHSVAIIN